MRSMETLIRLHRWQLDERRRVLRDLEEMQAEMESRLVKLATEILSEQMRAGNDDVRYAYAAFANSAIERRTTLMRSLEELSVRIEAAREQVAEAYRETKKYERLQEDRERRTKTKVEKVRQQEYDQTALNGYIRRRQAS